MTSAYDIAGPSRQEISAVLKRIAAEADAHLLGQVFSFSADYLPDPTDREPVLGALGPEMLRRARALPVWEQSGLPTG